ncbi:MAG: hypothetical protein ACTHPS_08550 [Streptosporangiaceae bacterium]
MQATARRKLAALDLPAQESRYLPVRRACVMVRHGSGSITGP